MIAARILALHGFHDVAKFDEALRDLIDSGAIGDLRADEALEAEQRELFDTNVENEKRMDDALSALADGAESARIVLGGDDPLTALSQGVAALRTAVVDAAKWLADDADVDTHENIMALADCACDDVRSERNKLKAENSKLRTEAVELLL